MTTPQVEAVAEAIRDKAKVPFVGPKQLKYAKAAIDALAKLVPEKINDGSRLLPPPTWPATTKPAATSWEKRRDERTGH